jgi:hypothetical protein
MQNFSINFITIVILNNLDYFVSCLFTYLLNYLEYFTEFIAAFIESIYQRAEYLQYSIS